MMDAPLSPYLTNIPDRTPRNKVHESLKQAKKAATFRVKGGELAVPVTIYEWKDGKGWETLWKLEAGTKRDDFPWN